jgi:dTDP-4-amino-4,6-dideoxy-D-galactose acyltransferase
MAKSRISPLDLKAARALLAEALPWSPHDYIPGLSTQGDKLLSAERWTRELPADDDLRISIDVPGVGPTAVFAERLPWDSEFFGYGVARMDGVFPLEPPLFRPTADYRPALHALLTAAKRRKIRYLTAFVEPRDLPTLRALGEEGFALIETRYFHHGKVAEPVLRERFPVRRARSEDVPSLAKTAREQVNLYDRFHADPFIDPQAAGRLMERWVEASVDGRMADLVVVPDVNTPTAFASYRYHREHWDRWGVRLVQGMLSAVSPESMGWLKSAAPEIQFHLASIGAEHSFGSTQATNQVILWHAQDAGARFGKCEHVFRKIL